MKSVTIVLRRPARRLVLAVSYLVLLFYAGLVAADKPVYTDNNGVPQYMQSEFEAIRLMLEQNAQKLDALSAQLETAESGLKAEIQSARDAIDADMLVLAQGVDDVMAKLNEPEKDIELTTEVCFNLGAAWDWAYTGKLAGGLGVELGLSGEAQLELAMPGLLPIVVGPAVPPISLPVVPAVGAGIEDTVCISVPLHSVASNDYWIKDFDTSEFDALISSAAMPAQFLLPGLAQAYGQVMPSPQEAMQFVEDGLALFSPQQASKSDLFADGLQSDGAASAFDAGWSARLAAMDSHDGMIQGSPLLTQLTQTNAIGNAINDPCAFASSIGLPGADAVAGTCGSTLSDLVLNFIDPLCVVDLVFPHSSCP